MVKENQYDPEAAALLSQQRLQEREEQARAAAAAPLNSRGRRRLRRFGSEARGFAAAGVPEQAAGVG